MIIGIPLMLLTLASLVVGIILMAKGGPLNKKYASKLMTARVIFQFLAVVLLGFLFLFVK